MNPLRQAATRLARPAFRTQIISRPTTATKSFSSTPRILASTTAAKTGDHASEHADHGHGHESHYDPPGGWLWGLRPGEKAPREGWEIPFYVICAGYVVAVIAYTMKEDTSYVFSFREAIAEAGQELGSANKRHRIQTWALEEARRRLEKEGLLEDPDTKSS